MAPTAPSSSSTSLERSLHGHALPHLKTVVLVYSFIDKREAIEPFDMGTTYPTATFDI